MSVRIEIVTLGDHYCAVFRRPGKPDEFLVDERGRPQRFASASVALRQGRKALVITDAPAIVPAVDDVLGIRAWRAAKNADLKAERDRVFGTSAPASIERNGRTIMVQRKRRR